MKNLFKSIILLITILSICSFILISDVFSKDNTDLSNEEELFIEEIQNKEIRIHYNKNLLYFKDSSSKEYGSLLPLINILKENISSNVSLIEGDAIYSEDDDNVINLYTQLDLYEKNIDEVDTFYSNFSSFVVVGDKNETIHNLNYGESKNVGFLYNLPQYNKLAASYENHEFFHSYEDIINAIKNNEINMAIIPSEEKLNLIKEPSLAIHLLLQNQENTPTFFSLNSDSKVLFGILEKYIKSMGLSTFSDEAYKAKSSYENYYFKDLFTSEIETVKKSYDKLTVQLGSNQYPFAFKSNEVYDGYSVDILNNFSEITGIEYEIYDEIDDYYISEEEVKTLFENNTIQIATSPIKNSENIKDFFFSYTILKAPLVLSTLDSDMIIDENMPIGTLYSINELTDTLFDYENLRKYSDIDKMLSDLKSGKLKAVITTEYFLDYNNKNNLRSVTLNKNRTLNTYSYATFSMKKDNTELNALLNDYIHAYKIFNPEEDDKWYFNYPVINENVIEKPLVSVYFVLLLILLIILLVLGFNLYRKRKKEKLLKLEITYDKEGYNLHPLTNYYSRNMYYEILKYRIEASPKTLGILLKWKIKSYDTILNKYGIKAWNKALVKYKNALDSLIEDNTLKFYLLNGVFACYIDNLTSLDEVNKIKDTILNTNVNVSVGTENFSNTCGSLVIFNHDTSDVNTLISYSTYTFNEAINYNINKIITFEESSYANTLNLSNKLNQLKDVFEKNSLSAVFQPIFDIQNNSLYGFEGLSRTTNKNFSNIVELIEISQIAKKNFQLSELMKKNVLNEFSKGDYKDTKLFINLDVSNLDGLFNNYEYDMKYINSLKLNNENIVAEITESHKINDYSKLNDICNKYRENGVLIALDDFGAGYSNTYHIIKLKPELIKLDRELIYNIDKDSYRQSVVKQLINLSIELKIAVLAEGVETKEELSFIRSIGVRYVQGYYLGKPNKLENFNLNSALLKLEA